MDESSVSFSSPVTPRPTGSGLKLVIPSLKLLNANKAKHRQNSLSLSSTYPNVVETPLIHEKKQPRPVKLKPLKEVLSKLISQIKKKDDYAFFLKPVDVKSVPGYSDVVKRPMDLGTMTEKVNRGKYKSLDDFSADLQLVTSNAKAFNPPGSIYYIEADRIEAWGMEHIAKAAGTVIQYAADWNLDADQDDEEKSVNVEDDDEYNVGTPMDIDNSSLRERSVSVLSQQPQPQQQAAAWSTGRTRGPRGPYKKSQQTAAATNALSETLEPDGALPGAKDGLGAFPACSDWARTMLALKHKGKRYKTKKERLRIEKEGPPLLADGSLDYTEMEDPFSVLYALVPDPLTRPPVVPLYPPLYQPPVLHLDATTNDPSSSSQPPQPQPSTSNSKSSFPAATMLPPSHTPSSLPYLTHLLASPYVTPSDGDGLTPQPTQIQQSQTRRRHWVINRNASSRKGKEKEDDSETVELPAWKMPREASAVDFGSFGVLAGAMVEEMHKRGLNTAALQNLPQGVGTTYFKPPEPSGVGGVSMAVPGQSTLPRELKETVDQDLNLNLLRHSLNTEAILKERGEIQSVQPAANGSGVTALTHAEILANGYWTSKRAAEAEEYLKDVVYGGVDGYAYARSLAEFVDGKTYYKEDADEPLHPSGLGMPLAEWVVREILDPVTEGRHSLIRDAGVELLKQNKTSPIPASATTDPREGTVASQVTASLHYYPAVVIALSALMHIQLHKIDMGALLRTPQELFTSEQEWAGKEIKERKRKAKTKEEDMDVEESPAAVAARKRMEFEAEGPEELGEVLAYVAERIVELNRKMREDGGSKANAGVTSNGHYATTNGSANAKKEEEEEGEGEEEPAPTPIIVDPAASEDPILRTIRLNLLALAKRAPLDTIARLPKDLVPEHYSSIRPTLGSSAS